MKTPETITHAIISVSQWPEPAKRAADALRRPLSRCILSDPRAGTLMAEMGIDLSIYMAQEDNTTNSGNGRPVTDVLSTVLSTVRELRAVVHMNQISHNLFPTTPLWSMLIKTLGLACSDDLTFLYVPTA